MLKPTSAHSGPVLLEKRPFLCCFTPARATILLVALLLTIFLLPIACVVACVCVNVCTCAPTCAPTDFNLMRTLQSAQRSFVITDPYLPDNPIVFASQEFLRFTGYSSEQVLLMQAYAPSYDALKTGFFSFEGLLKNTVHSLDKSAFFACTL